MRHESRSSLVQVAPPAPGGLVGPANIIFAIGLAAIVLPTMIQVATVSWATEQGVTLVDYIYEPGRAEILDRVLPQSVRLHAYKAILDSIAAEHGARMSAMDSASSNAKKAIGRLTLQYNRARQAAITKELMEIVSGAESLK